MKLVGTIPSSQRPAIYDPAVQPHFLIKPQLLTYIDPPPAGRDIPFSPVFHVSRRLVSHQPFWDRRGIGALEQTGSNSAVLTQLAQYPLAYCPMRLRSARSPPHAAPAVCSTPAAFKS
jgi:hypothetical protein